MLALCRAHDAKAQEKGGRGLRRITIRGNHRQHEFISEAIRRNQTQSDAAAISGNQTQSDETPSSVPPRNQTQSVTRFLRRSQGHSSQSDTTIRRDSFVGPSSQSDAIRCIRDTLSLIMLAFRFEHDSSEPHPLLTFEVKSKRLLCINCQTEELLVYEATYHADVLQTGYIMYTRTPQGQRVRRGNCES